MLFFDNEESIKSNNERENKKINIDMALFGYKENNTDFFKTKEYEELLLDFIKSKNIIIYNHNLPSQSTKIIRNQANKALIAQTRDIDRKILYIENEDRVIYDFEGEFNTKLDKSCADEFIKYLKKKARVKEVTNIEPTWSISGHRNGRYHATEIYTKDIDIIKKYPVICTGITLINQNNTLASTVLVHEMAHALLDRNKGIVENRLHNETLSIYLELVAASELDPSGHLLKLTLIDRLQDTKNEMLDMYYNEYNGYAVGREAIYIDSTLYAFALFEKYQNASILSRIALRKEVNKTLSGDRLLEDTLAKLDITEEEGSAIIREKIKTMLK